MPLHYASAILMSNNGVSLRQTGERPPELTENDPEGWPPYPTGPAQRTLKVLLRTSAAVPVRYPRAQRWGPEFFMCTWPALAKHRTSPPAHQSPHSSQQG